MKVYLSTVEDFEDKSLYSKLYNLVSNQRKSKIDKYIFEKDKRLSLGAGVLLRYGMTEAGINPGETNIINDDNGKPSLLGIDEFYFNLSHSEEMVMCVTSKSKVGCDIEKINDIYFEIAKRFFFSTEYDLINSQPTHKEKIDMFYRLWTLKESFMKATGLGMSLPLDSFKIDIKEKNITVKHNVDGNIYYFKEYSLHNYKCSCCSLTNDFPNKPEFIQLCQIYDRLC